MCPLGRFARPMVYARMVRTCPVGDLVQRPYRRPKAVGSDRGGGGSASSSCDSSGSSSSSSNSKNSYNIADLMWLAATAAAVVETETATTAMAGQYQTTI